MLAPFAQPLYVMLKPAGPRCNLACDYCYYLEKQHLFTDSRRQLLDDSLLERFIREYIALQTTPDVLFTWHGGEPLLRPITYYEKAFALQRKYADGRNIDNCFQTNGTLITDQWARFFKKNNILVGVSIDGPEDVHDAYRHTVQQRGTHSQVMRGIRTLMRHGVEWNAMAVVNDINVKEPLEFYHFFKEIGARYIQFTPIVERLYTHADGRHLASPIEGDPLALSPMSITPDDWGQFLITIFDEWVRHDVGETFVQLFDATLAGWMGVPPSICSMAATCGHAPVMEWNGDVFVCDHYVFPEFKLGNMKQQSLKEIIDRPERLEFGRNKERLLTRQCRECDYLMACHGECPKNRFARSADGETGHNYLCAGYHAFFQHVAPYMDYMKKQLMHKQAPAHVMEWIRQGMPE